MLPFSRNLLGIKCYIAHTIGVAIYAVVFLLLFRPYELLKMMHLDSVVYNKQVCIVVFMCFAFTMVSRAILLFIPWKDKYGWNCYIPWCVLEALLTSFVVAFYVCYTFLKEISFFYVLGPCMLYTMTTLLIPHTLITLIFIVMDLYNTSKTSPESIPTDIEDNIANNKIRFVDSSDNTKLLISADHVLYIQADENYLKVYYLDGATLSICSIRNSMKAIEEICISNDIIRSHRSYYVNKHKIKTLAKEKDFVYAVLDYPDVVKVPISKSYIEQFSSFYDSITRVM